MRRHQDTSRSASAAQGAILANGARIEEINADYVVLTRDGQHVRLYVDGHAPADSRSSDGALLMVGGAGPETPALPTSTDELTDHIRVTPVDQGDLVHALAVYANDGSTVFARLGLEPGDRITAIDGEAVTDSPDAVTSLRRLTRDEALQVTEERGALANTRPTPWGDA